VDGGKSLGTYIEKVLERYNTLIYDSIIGNKVEILDYKF
jgi:hypothetical protein